MPLPQQLARWAKLAEGLEETRLPALPAAAEHPTVAALAMRALAHRIIARVDWTIGINMGAGHGHGTVSAASHPLAAAMKLSLTCTVIKV